MLANEDKFRIFTGNANPDLAREIAAYLGTTLGDAVINRFNNGEVQAMINESVRGKDVFIVQPTCGPIVNDNVMELLIMADAFKRASANHIIAVIPFYGYARQDRKARGREPITAKLMADILQCAGITRVLTIDLHAAQIQGFFNIPLDHMPAAPVLADYIKQKDLKDMIVVSPDLGGVSRARVFAERLNCGLAIIDKRRPEPGVAEVRHGGYGRFPDRGRQGAEEVWGQRSLCLLHPSYPDCSGYQPYRRFGNYGTGSDQYDPADAGEKTPQDQGAVHCPDSGRNHAANLQRLVRKPAV